MGNREKSCEGLGHLGDMDASNSQDVAEERGREREYAWDYCLKLNVDYHDYWSFYLSQK